jgi:hypothetical protein
MIEPTHIEMQQKKKRKNSKQNRYEEYKAKE